MAGANLGKYSAWELLLHLALELREVVSSEVGKFLELCMMIDDRMMSTASEWFMEVFSFSSLQNFHRHHSP